MVNTITNKDFNFLSKHVVLDMRNSFTCSFTEFFPFCNKLYYFSNFKDFNRFAQA